jgi:hypothetical protein
MIRDRLSQSRALASPLLTRLKSLGLTTVRHIMGLDMTKWQAPGLHPALLEQVYHLCIGLTASIRCMAEGPRKLRRPVTYLIPCPALQVDVYHMIHSGIQECALTAANGHPLPNPR